MCEWSLWTIMVSRASCYCFSRLHSRTGARGASSSAVPRPQRLLCRAPQRQPSPECTTISHGILTGRGCPWDRLCLHCKVGTILHLLLPLLSLLPVLPLLPILPPLPIQSLLSILLSSLHEDFSPLFIHWNPVVNCYETSSQYSTIYSIIYSMSS